MFQHITPSGTGTGSQSRSHGRSAHDPRTVRLHFALHDVAPDADQSGYQKFSGSSCESGIDLD
jgi:hypothetical protein